MKHLYFLLLLIFYTHSCASTDNNDDKEAASAHPSTTFLQNAEEEIKQLIEGLWNRNQQLESEKEELHDKLNFLLNPAFKASMDLIQQQNAALSGEVEELKKEKELLKKQASTPGPQIFTDKDKYENLLEELINSTLKNDELAKTIKDLNHELQQVKQLQKISVEKDEEIKKQLNDLVAGKDEAEKKLAAASKAYSDLEKDYNQQLDKHTRYINDHAIEYASLQNALRNLKAEKAQLEKEKKESDQVRLNHAVLESQLEETQRKYLELQSQKLKEEEEYKGLNESLREEREILKQRYEELQASLLKESESLKDELASTPDPYEHEEEINKLRQAHYEELLKKDQEYNEFINQLKKHYTEELASKELELMKLEKLKTLPVMLEERERLLKGYELQISQIVEELDKAKQQYENLQREYHAYQHNARTEKDKQAAEFKTLKEVFDNLQTAFKDKEKNHAETLNTLLKQHKIDSSAKVKEIDDLKKLQKENDQKSREDQEALKNEILKANQALKNLEEQHKKDQDSLSASHIKELKSKEEELKKLVDTHNVHVQKLTDTLEQLKKDHESLKNIHANELEKKDHEFEKLKKQSAQALHDLETKWQVKFKKALDQKDAQYRTMEQTGLKAIQRLRQKLYDSRKENQRAAQKSARKERLQQKIIIDLKKQNLFERAWFRKHVNAFYKYKRDNNAEQGNPVLNPRAALLKEYVVRRQKKKLFNNISLEHQGSLKTANTLPESRGVGLEPHRMQNPSTEAQDQQKQADIHAKENEIMALRAELVQVQVENKLMAQMNTALTIQIATLKGEREVRTQERDRVLTENKVLKRQNDLLTTQKSGHEQKINNLLQLMAASLQDRSRNSARSAME